MRRGFNMKTKKAKQSPSDVKQNTFPKPMFISYEDDAFYHSGLGAPHVCPSRSGCSVSICFQNCQLPGCIERLVLPRLPFRSLFVKNERGGQNLFLVR